MCQDFEKERIMESRRKRKKPHLKISSARGKRQETWLKGK